jgi:osmoprotectant transport system ATP-binding protein
MTVPSLLGWDRKRARARATELLELVGLDPQRFAKRYPHELSGGQRQRVGVARALAGDPPVLLMDEPFGAVDPIARDRLQDEFHRLQRNLGITVVFVTHDIEEAVRLGDRIAVMREGGHLEQYDTPAAILGSPATSFVADFVGTDRGLKRLAVTAIRSEDLEHPPVVGLHDAAADAAAELARLGSHWAVVLDEDGALRGWVGRDRLVDDGTVERSVRRMEAWVPVDSPLKSALATMLQNDAGWVAVLDGDRYLGVLTPATLHEALRRSVVADATDVADQSSVDVDTVARA